MDNLEKKIANNVKTVNRILAVLIIIVLGMIFYSYFNREEVVVAPKEDLRLFYCEDDNLISYEP